jgi:spoIIIJ-associated protein
MDNSLEITGKSADEAVEKGLVQLGLRRDQVEVEIVREASRGVFGLGGEEALVRLTARAAASAPAQAGANREASHPQTSDPNAEVAKDILEELLRGMGFTASVEAHPTDEPDAFVLNIEGNDLGVLIGRRGETLHDLEFITRLLVQQRAKGMVKLSVDVENYRGRRERQLRELGLRMAERVQASKQPITLEAMPPNERRIVHLALRDHETVTTQSIGEGEHRRVMILPKK